MRAKPITRADGDPQVRRLLNPSADSRITSFILGTTLFGIWSWWALSDGAFFGTVLLPGAVLIYLVLTLPIGLARQPISIRGPHAVAFAAFAVLAAWTALSILWSPARDLALDYSERSFLYAAAFAAGLALATALRSRLLLSAGPLIAAGLIVAAVVVIRIWTAADIKPLIDADGTLDYPFGYRNANAGFFVLIAFASMPLIARRGSLPIRASLTALASGCLALAVIGQSRGSVLAVLGGVAALLAVSPARGRALIALVVVAAPVALVFAQLLDPYEAVDTPAALAEMQGAATAAVIAAAVGALLSISWFALERRGVSIPGVPLPRVSRRSGLLGGLATLVVVLVAFTAAVGNPYTEIRDRLDLVSASDTSYGDVSGSRFTYGGGLNRIDYWKVALEQAQDAPVIGGGAGSFRSTYLTEGNGEGRQPRNAHSIAFEMLGELGIVGLGLLLLGFGAATLAALRSRRLGPESAILSTIALVAAAVVLAQALVDWSWFFGGLMAPVFALLGAAAAPSALSLRMLPRKARWGLVTASIALAIVAVPSFASERLTLDAARGWRDDLEGAYSALETAADFNPLAEDPLLVEAEIARHNGDAVRALAALARARHRSPDDWRGYLLAARVLAKVDPARALEEANAATALNPTSTEAAQLHRKLTEGAKG